MDSKPGVTLGLSSLGIGGFISICLTTVVSKSELLKGKVPVTSSYKIIPNVYKSARGSTSNPLMTSGAI